MLTMIQSNHNLFLPDSGLGTYYWEEAPVKTKSRSGHTAVLAPSLRHGGDLYGLFVFGGRDDESIHKCGQWPAAEVELEVGSEHNTRLVEDVRRLVSQTEVTGQCQPTPLRCRHDKLLTS